MKNFQCNVEVTLHLSYVMSIKHVIWKKTLFCLIYIQSQVNLFNIHSLLSNTTPHSSKMYSPSTRPLRNNRFDFPHCGPSTVGRKRLRPSTPIKQERDSTALPDSIPNSVPYLPTYSTEYDEDTDSESVHSIPHSPENLGQQSNSFSRVLAEIKGKHVLNNYTTTARASSQGYHESLFDSHGFHTTLSSIDPQQPTRELTSSMIPCSSYSVPNTPYPPQGSCNSLRITGAYTTFCIGEALQYIGSKLDANFMEILSKVDPVLFSIKKSEETVPLAFVLCTEDYDPIEGLKQLSLLSNQQSTAKLIWITKSKIGFFERDSDNPLLISEDLIYLKPICPPTHLFPRVADIHMEMSKLGVMFLTGLRRVKGTRGSHLLKSDFSAFFFDIKRKRHQIFIHYLMDMLEVEEVKNKRGRKRKIQ